MSPSGGSTLITSAPRSAISLVAKEAATPEPHSTTEIPLSSPVDSGMMRFPGFFSRMHVEAATHSDRLAGDERGVGGGEEGDGRRNVLGLAQPAHRSVLGLARNSRHVFLDPFREHDSRCDRVASDAFG